MDNFLAVDRVAFRVGDFEIYWYGVIICLAIIVAVVVATMFCKARKYNTEIPLNIALVILPTGILAARFFAVIFDDSLVLSDYFNFRTGGMSIIGAVIGGGLGLLAYCLLTKKTDKMKYFDVLTVVLILAQAIGRWGNFFNGEVYGQVIDASSKFATFPFAVEVDGVFYQALFFYEFVLNLIAFGIMDVIFLKENKCGYVTGAYLVLYGVIRTGLEMLRQNEYILRLKGLPISLICSVLMIAAGVVILVMTAVGKKKLEVVKNEQKK